MKKALFLDRDGTINIDKIGAYVTKPEEFDLIPQVSKALMLAKSADFQLVIVTNQAGIGKGLYTIEDLRRIHDKMEKKIARELGDDDFHFDHIEFCPHRSEENCACRKPKPLMIERAAKKLSIDVSRSFYIGDKDTDLLCAYNSGMRSILVQTGYGKVTQDEIKDWKFGKPITTEKDLLSAVEFILSKIAAN